MNTLDGIDIVCSRDIERDCPSHNWHLKNSRFPFSFFLFEKIMGIELEAQISKFGCAVKLTMLRIFTPLYHQLRELTRLYTI